MIELLAKTLWVMTGCWLVVMFLTMGLAIVAAGELRGGLEIWNDAFWNLVSFGRWNKQEEDWE